MTIGLSYLDDLSRVRVDISGRPNGAVSVERSANELLWTVVRGGVSLPLVAGAATLDDYEFYADVPNFYRITQVSLEDIVDVFTADGTWNKPPGLTAVWVRVWGGGGAGGGAAATAAGESSIGRGGAAGGYAEKFIDAASLGASEAVTIGPAGAGVNGGTGGNGGTTSFGAHVSATGGNGGIVVTTTATIAWAGTIASGVGQNGDLNLPGGQDGMGFSSPGLARGGSGGAAVMGAGANAEGTNSVNGRAALGFGNGGSGASNNDSEVTARIGGAGAPGLVVVMNIFAA